MPLLRPSLQTALVLRVILAFAAGFIPVPVVITGGASGIGLAVAEALIAEGDFSKESGASAMRRLLEANPDAVFVSVGDG